MTTLQFATTFAGTQPDEEDRRAMNWYIDEVNKSRVEQGLQPHLKSTPQERNQTYQGLMAAKNLAIHQEHIKQATEQYAVKDLIARLRLASDAQLASVAALLPQLPTP